MSRMDRREFLGKTAATLGTARGMKALVGGCSQLQAPTRTVLRANDVIRLGKTGITTSRLAMGTGSRGGRKQKALGIDGMVKLFRYGLDQGISWWETADTYKTHPHVRAALKEVERDKVVITSKTWAAKKDAQGVRKDIERFRKELNTDYIDIVLLHCMQDPKWPEKLTGAMDVLSEYKQKGIIRAVGCSCHTFGALQAAADEPWVEVNLARFNPFAVKMDVKKIEDVPKVEQTLRTMHERGKSVYGMKIMGEGAFDSEQIDESLRFVLSKPFISGFTIGFSSPEQIDNLMARMERASQTA